jgi:hypothetical protein
VLIGQIKALFPETQFIESPVFATIQAAFLAPVPKSHQILSPGPEFIPATPIYSSFPAFAGQGYRAAYSSGTAGLENVSG